MYVGSCDPSKAEPSQSTAKKQTMSNQKSHPFKDDKNRIMTDVNTRFCCNDSLAQVKSLGHWWSNTQVQNSWLFYLPYRREKQFLFEIEKNPIS